MARRRNTAGTLDKSKQRLAGLNAISPTLDLGEGLTVGIYANKISAQENRFSRYNSLLAEVEALADELANSDAELREWDSRMLSGVLARYGRDSLEYQKAGGTRLSERKKPVRTSTPPSA